MLVRLDAILAAVGALQNVDKAPIHAAEFDIVDRPVAPLTRRNISLFR